MNLTTGQQRLVFVVIVLVLAGLGFWLVSSHNSGSAAAALTPSASASPSAAATGAAYVPPTAVPSATPASTAGGGEIYQWLPFSASDLTAAASATTAFSDAYATWSYHDTAAAYGARLKPLVTAPELTTLENDYGTPGVAGPRAADKQVSAATSSVSSISAFAPGSTSAPLSITFVVAISQKVTSTQPATTVNGTYDVTVEQAGGGWQVSGLQLSGLGNAGQGSPGQGGS